MNRKTRNIIMIILLILLIAGTVFTVFHKERTMYGGQENQMQAPGMEGQQPPQGQQGQNGQMQPPPTPEGVPEGTTPPQAPGMQQQPQQPAQGQQGQQPPQGQNGQQPPATPEGVPEGTTPPQAPGMNGQMQPPQQPVQQNVEMPTYFYFVFGAEGLAISLILIYLIMSQMNKKSFRHVFSSGTKKMAFIVMVCALTAAITFGCANITLPKPEPTQPQAPPGPDGSVAAASISELF